ncbi:hypothetical protein B0H10DRAFT_2271548 [Mycena sp. CBHHK59/15]|nr:hypothetical protein B0H10DRAFT_2271548 [Mycena sp. CBHHK59/15]
MAWARGSTPRLGCGRLPCYYLRCSDMVDSGQQPTSHTRDQSAFANRGKGSTRGSGFMGHSASYSTSVGSGLGRYTYPLTLRPGFCLNNRDSFSAPMRVVPNTGASQAEDLPLQSSSPESDDEAVELHSRPYIRCLILLVAFLHTKHHTSFRACALILLALNFIFATIPGNLLGSQEIPRTLTTIFARLELTDRFMPAVIPASLGAEQIGEADDDLGYNAKRTPHLVAPIQLLSEGLKDFFDRPGMVRAVNSWKSRTIVEGELRSMQDAKVWNTINGPDNKSFFFGGKSEKELRIGVTLSLDW